MHNKLTMGKVGSFVGEGTCCTRCMQHILLPFVDVNITNEAAQPVHDMTTWFCRDVTLEERTQVKTPNFSRAF